MSQCQQNKSFLKIKPHNNHSVFLKITFFKHILQINSKYRHIYCRYKSIKKIIKLWQILIIYLKNLTATCH